MLALALCGCRCDRPSPAGDPGDAAPPWDVSRPSPPARAGMVWVEPGVLIAGTPPGRLPRVADEELPGVRVEMTGFFIDRFNHPGETGAIPLTGVSQAEARRICEEQDKRLCTELEWERACKGPENHVYDYGDRYDAAVCGTGVTDALAPNGANTRCASAFEVRDMHGSAYNWTSSAWGRGTKGNKIAIRGGNGREGELIGRCANARAMSPTQADGRVGVRCCAGELNAAEVALEVRRGRALSWRPPDAATARRLAAAVPESIAALVKGRPQADGFAVERIWTWRPVGNEELMVGGGCAHPPGHDACGVVIVRARDDEVTLLAYVSSDWWIPTIGEHDAARALYLYGGDQAGAFRKEIVYDWGRIAEGDKYRKKGQGWLRPR